MGKHVDAEVAAEHFPILSVVLMLCVTAVITVIAVSGSPRDAGGVACAAIMCGSFVAAVKLLRRGK